MVLKDYCHEQRYDHETQLIAYMPLLDRFGRKKTIFVNIFFIMIVTFIFNGISKTYNNDTSKF
jgi:hypothetical protein